jgi:uncharacterized protein YjgD (DUF1641 family)
VVNVLLDGVVQVAQPDELLIEVINRTFGGAFSGASSRNGSRVSSQAIPEGIAQATAERERPVSFFGLLRRLSNKDTLLGLAVAIDFLEAFGRHLQSSESQTPQN